MKIWSRVNGESRGLQTTPVRISYNLCSLYYSLYFHKRLVQKYNIFNQYLPVLHYFLYNKYIYLHDTPNSIALYMINSQVLKVLTFSASFHMHTLLANEIVVLSIPFYLLGAMADLW